MGQMAATSAKKTHTSILGVTILHRDDTVQTAGFVHFPAEGAQDFGACLSTFGLAPSEEPRVIIILWRTVASHAPIQF